MSNPNIDQEGRVWKWAIEPHPYDRQYDVMVTDDDQKALEAILHVAEMHLWDSNNGGETRILQVTHKPENTTPPERGEICNARYGRGWSGGHQCKLTKGHFGPHVCEYDGCCQEW